MSKSLRVLFVPALLLSACGDEEESTPPEAELDPAVGYLEVELEYSPAGLPSGEAPRIIRSKIWYPALTDGTDSGARYAVAGIVQLQAQGVLDEPEPAPGPHPVAVYSHGSGGDGLLGYPFGELFAENGWILVAPDHTGNTALDGVTDSLQPFSRVALFRPQDVSATLDWLESDEARNAVGEADTSEVFVTGHSFGGATTLSLAGADLDYDTLLASCGEPTSVDCEFLATPGVETAFDAGTGDPRVVAIAPQAPALIAAYGTGEIEAISIPTLLMSGRLDQTTTQSESAEPAWAALDRASNIWVDLPTGAHFTFVTICDDLDPAIRALLQPDADQDGCGASFIPSAEAVPIIGEYLLAFARWHVLGETEQSGVFETDIEGFVVTEP